MTSDGSWASGRSALPGLWSRAEPSPLINLFKNNSYEGHVGVDDADLKGKEALSGLESLLTFKVSWSYCFGSFFLKKKINDLSSVFLI